MYRLVLSLAALSFLWLHDLSAYEPPVCNRQTYNFNLGWRLFVGDPNGAQLPDFDDSNWKTVSLPRAWNEDFAFRVSIAQLPTGIAWYRKHFKLPKESAAEKVFLEFEGIRQAGEFYLNGKHIGTHENGVMAFGFDITELVLPWPSQNVLAVRIDNSWDYRERSTGTRFQWNDRNFYANYGGINKNVRLHITDRLYQTLPLYSFLGTTGVYVYATDFDLDTRSATITASSQVKNEYAVDKTFEFWVAIEDMDSNCVARFSAGPVTIEPGQTITVSASSRIKGLKFWSWGYGYLYNVYTILDEGGKAIDVVRTRTGFRKTDFANGMFRLNGRVLHLKGYAQRTTNEWPALGSAIPAWLSDLSNRMIVEGNGCLVRWMHVTPWKQDVESCDRVGLIQAMPAGDSEGDARGRQWEQRLELMRDAIIYNRNNPSIIFYEAGNKGISEQHIYQMKAIRDQYDPYGGRAIGCREMLESKLAEYGGEMLYINKSADKPMWAMEYSRDEGLRKYWDEFSPPYHKDGDGPPYRGDPARQYNRNQDSHAIEDVIRWYDYWEHRPGSGPRVNAGGVNIIFSDTNTHFRGAENYRRSGEVDPLRLPKDAYWAHQVIWDGWVDPERPRLHIIGHWNYRPGIKKDIHVVSNTDSVELQLNGRSLGRGINSYKFLFTFNDVEYQPGQLVAIGLDKDGKACCKAVKQTAGQPAAIRLTAITGPGGLKADGADVALVQVEVVDANGLRCPTSLAMVNFQLEGPAEWRGGIAQGPDNHILSKDLPVECGVNRVLLRSTTAPGVIRLKASSEGLLPDHLTLSSHRVDDHQGLGILVPGPELPSYLGRGPTPAGPSFRPWRKALAIESISAGANQDRAYATIDDNEATSWSNDNMLATAWICYSFRKPASPNQIVLKLGNWRNRSYPLRIWLDDRQIWQGFTPKSLGYVTIPLTGAKGRQLKIELLADPSVPQLNPGQGDQQGPSRSSGTLTIVEFECYEPLAE